MSREEIETFEPNELENILKTSQSDRWYPSLFLAVTTGMRLGEVLGLRWQDIDFNESCVYVRQTLQHASTGIILEEPKSKASNRKITTPKETVDCLKSHKKAVLEKRLALGISNELCFTADNESPIQPKNYQRWWTKIQREANEEWQELEQKKTALAQAGTSYMVT